jgi:hypothetical protein
MSRLHKKETSNRKDYTIDKEYWTSRTSKAPVKLHFSWFVFRRGMTTERTGMLGLYLAMSLQII